jgi:EpsI family protein
MSNRRFFILVAVLVVGIGLSFAFGRLGHPLTSAAFRDLKLPFAEFPLEIGTWKGTTHRLSNNVRKIAGMDRYLLRQYVDEASGRAVQLYLSYYGNKDRGMRAIYHNPTICLPASGWEWADSQTRTVTLVDAGLQFEVSLDRFRLSGRERVILNFSIVNGRVIDKPIRNEPLEIAAEKFRISTEPGYFVQAQVVPLRWPEGENAGRVALEFLEEAGRYVFLHF